MVLLVLAIIWAALLFSWFRSRSGEILSDSVGTFRRHLRVLEKATPAAVVPANRLRDARGSSRQGRTALAARAGVPVLAGGPKGWAAASVAGSQGRPVYRSVSAQQVAMRRRQAQRRRRDVFFALLAGVAGSLVLALIPGLSVMWTVQVIFDLLLVGYVSVLVRVRNRVAERDLKLRFLPSQGQRPARPARQYEFVPARYGDLDLRQAVN